MSISYGAVTVTTSPTLILASNSNRKGCMVFNNSSLTIYLGFDSSVTTSNGMILPGQGYYFDSGIGDAYRSSLYGVTPSSTADVRYQEWSQ